MPNPAIALGGAGLALGVIGSSKAADAQKKASQAAAAEQRAALDYQKEISAPYRALGDAALPTYYQMLGLQPPTDMEQVAATGAQALPGLTQGIGGALRVGTQGGAPQPSGPLPLSPLAQWQQQQAFKQQGRAESARGLSGSGGSAAREADITSGIAASDYMNQYSRILDALKIGSGASASAGSAQQTYANNVSEIGLQQGQNQGNFWQGLGAAPLDAYNLYQKTQTPQAVLPAAPSVPSSTVYSPQGFEVDSSKYSTYF